MKKNNFLNYLILFGWITFPSFLGKLDDKIGINWLYLNIISLFLLFGIISNRTKVLIPNSIKIYGIFILYLIISFIWSFSPFDGLRYINKFIFGLFLMVYLYKNLEATEFLFNKIIYSIILFLTINILFDLFFRNIFWKYPNGQFFEGLGGRHTIKYYLAFSIIFLNFAYYFLRKKNYLILLAISLLVLYLVFQRGVIAAITISLLISYYLILRNTLKHIVMYMLLSFSLIIVSAYILFFTDIGTKYMFYNESYNMMFLSEVKENPIDAIRYIDFKGRIEYWNLLLNKFSKSNIILGLGFGSSPFIIFENFGFYNELHSDLFQILFELGFLGFLLIVLFWSKLFADVKLIISRNLHKKEKIFVFSLLSYAIFIILNGIVDHVIDYPTTQFCLGFLIAIVYRIKQSNKL